MTRHFVSFSKRRKGQREKERGRERESRDRMAIKSADRKKGRKSVKLWVESALEGAARRPSNGARLMITIIFIIIIDIIEKILSGQKVAAANGTAAAVGQSFDAGAGPAHGHEDGRKERRRVGHFFPHGHGIRRRKEGRFATRNSGPAAPHHQHQHHHHHGHHLSIAAGRGGR